MNRLATSITAALAVALFGVAGCNIVAPVFFAVHGPGEVKKATSLDSTRRTVILIDDPANRVAQRRYRSLIGEVAQQTLLDRGLIEEGLMIDTRSALAVASRGAASDPLSIAEVGQAVDADVVIYALVTDFALTAGGESPSPTSNLRVKLVDTQTGERLWPADIEGYPLNVTMPRSGNVLPSSRTEAAVMQDALAKQTGLALAQLFYDVEVTQSVRR